MLDKVYINLDNIGKDGNEELEEFKYLFFEDDETVIWNKFRIQRKEFNNEKQILNVQILELFLLVNYLRKLGYNENNIEILIDKPMFIHNDDLYKIEDSKCYRMKTENVGFFSVRGSNWGYPFFFILKQIIESKGGAMRKTNDINRNILYKGKLYALNTLYPKREELIGNIVIPYKISSNHFEIFRDFLKRNLGSRIVLKKDATQLGQGVFVIDLEDFNDVQKKKFDENMKTHAEFLKEIYIVPFEEFQEEYRIYFTKFSDDTKIYSLKKKKVTSDIKQILDTPNFEYYTNVMLEWEYIENKDWNGKYMELFEKSMYYIQNLEYTTGALEFGKTKDGRLVFFEVNSMADPVCYEGEDISNMASYYKGLFKDFTY